MDTTWECSRQKLLDLEENPNAARDPQLQHIFTAPRFDRDGTYREYEFPVWVTKEMKCAYHHFMLLSKNYHVVTNNHYAPLKARIKEQIRLAGPNLATSRLLQHIDGCVRRALPAPTGYRTWYSYLATLAQRCHRAARSADTVAELRADAMDFWGRTQGGVGAFPREQWRTHQGEVKKYQDAASRWRIDCETYNAESEKIRVLERQQREIARAEKQERDRIAREFQQSLDQHKARDATRNRQRRHDDFNDRLDDYDTEYRTSQQRQTWGQIQHVPLPGDPGVVSRGTPEERLEALTLRRPRSSVSDYASLSSESAAEGSFLVRRRGFWGRLFRGG